MDQWGQNLLVLGHRQGIAKQTWKSNNFHLSSSVGSKPEQEVKSSPQIFVRIQGNPAAV
jgi:hypothetical protein